MSALDESLRILIADVHAWREAKRALSEAQALDPDPLPGLPAAVRSARIEVWSAYARLGDALMAEIGIEGSGTGEVRR